MSEDQQTYQRAAVGALVGLAIQVVAGLFLLILGAWAGNPALYAASAHAFGGLALWVCLWMVYHQHRLERIEALEAEQLSRRGGTDNSIFEAAADDLSLARRRLERLHKWGLPIVSLLTAGYLIGVGVWLFGRYRPTLQAPPIVEEPALAMAFVAGLTLVAFLVSRYLAGMARIDAWQLLRGGAAYLMGLVLVGVALIVGLAMTHFEQPVLMNWLAVLVPAFMVVIGAEMALNFILALYRPRRPGVVDRASFDSRLLGLLTSPESLATTVSEAINYQFGFEITRSWFWQLFSRAFVPLVIFGVVVLVLVSSFVVVQPHERTVITRFGALHGEPRNPGLHLKAPWPIDRAHPYAVDEIRRLRIGSVEELLDDVPILWTNEHTVGEESLLIAGPPRELDASGRQVLRQRLDGEAAAPSVSLVSAQVSVFYRIDGDRLLEYIGRHAEADAVLRSISEQALARYLISRDVDTLVGRGRAEAAPLLKGWIQRAADDYELGLKIVDVAVASIHPAQSVAGHFHEVVMAEQERQIALERARRLAIQTLVEAAGDEAMAMAIGEKYREYQALEEAHGDDHPDVVALVAELRQLVDGAGGEAARVIAEARAERWSRENAERAAALRFEKELEAFNAAPNLYRMRQYLEVLAEGLSDARKYLLVADRDRLTLRFDFKDIERGMGGIDLSAD